MSVAILKIGSGGLPLVTWVQVCGGVQLFWVGITWRTTQGDKAADVLSMSGWNELIEIVQMASKIHHPY